MPIDPVVLQTILARRGVDPRQIAAISALRQGGGAPGGIPPQGVPQRPAVMPQRPMMPQQRPLTPAAYPPVNPAVGAGGGLGRFYR